MTHSDDEIDKLIEATSYRPPTLAELYRTAKQRGLIQPHPQYR